MTTDSERREVARSLRRLAEKHDGVAWPLVEKHLGLVGDDRFLGSSVYTSASVLHVAGLIDPEPERACEWLWGEEWLESTPENPRELQWANWHLNCGCWDGDEDELCDFDDPDSRPTCWSFCPRCGARVAG